MKQSAAVIAALFASASAQVAAPNANLTSAKERLHNDISGFIKSGYEFDKDVVQASDAAQIRNQKINNTFEGEVNANVAEGHKVLDDYMSAYEYEKSQVVYTPPTAANYQWGEIHYNNPQKIMDGYVAAFKADQELGQDWVQDVQNYGAAMQKSNQQTGNTVIQSWETNGQKMQGFANDIPAAVQGIQAASPQSLAAVNDEAVKQDLDNFLNNVGHAADAVRQTEQVAQKADQLPNKAIQQATLKYMQQKEQINQQFANAVEFEVENFHYNAGQPGGQGSLSFSNKQEIVNNWTKPIQANQIATQEFADKIKINMEAKKKIHQMAKMEAEQVWPAKFQAVESSWKKLAGNFKQSQPQPASLASRADILKNVESINETGAAVDNAVIDDVLEFVNDTQTQRATLAQEVEQFMGEREAINQQYADAWNYEMEQINFNQNATTGKWSFTENNQETVIDNWSNAETSDIVSRQELKNDFINYQRSIAAEKAAFQATANAQWPAKFQAFGNSLKQFQATMQPQPAALITNAQHSAADDIRASIYDDINQRLALRHEIKTDLKAYFENTNDARTKLANEANDWKAAGQRVSGMYAAAWNYQIEQTHFTPSTATAPASISQTNVTQAGNNWRSAAQADENLGNQIMGDIMNYGQSIQPQRDALKNEIQTKWFPDAEAVHNSDQQIAGEVMNFPMGNSTAPVDQFHQQISQHIPHSLMSIGSGSSTLSMNEQIAYGSVFLSAMIAIAALSNKGKATKTVEFDVEDLEMTNKKESKKQIKKTLKDIMKTSNTKVTLMNN